MNAIDLFSGAGGLTRATCDSGFNIVLSNEVNPVFAKTHHYNFRVFLWLQMILIT